MAKDKRDVEEAFDEIVKLFAQCEGNLEKIKELLLACNTKAAEAITSAAIAQLNSELAKQTGAGEHGTSEAASSSPEKTLYCSFCGKSQHEVKKMIAGPASFICDECVVLCMDTIREESGPASDS